MKPNRLRRNTMEASENSNPLSLVKLDASKLANPTRLGQLDASGKTNLRGKDYFNTLVQLNLLREPLFETSEWVKTAVFKQLIFCKLVFGNNKAGYFFHLVLP